MTDTLSREQQNLEDDFNRQPRQPEATSPTPENKPRFGRRQKLIATIALGAGVVTGATIGIASAANAPHQEATQSQGDTGGENVKLTIDQKVQENITNRPAEGTPEYNAIFEPLIIPYVEGQPSAEVVQEYASSIQLLSELGASDAPKPGLDISQWQIDTSKSVPELVTSLQLDYYDQGADDAVFGDDWKNNPDAQFYAGNLSQNHADHIANILNVNTPAKVDNPVTTLNLSLESSTDIIGTAQTTKEDNSATKGGDDLTFHLQVKTEKSGLVHWVWVGNS